MHSEIIFLQKTMKKEEVNILSAVESDFSKLPRKAVVLEKKFSAHYTE